MSKKIRDFDEYVEGMRQYEMYRHAHDLATAIMAHMSDDDIKVLSDIHRQMMAKIDDENVMRESFLAYLNS